MVKFLKKSVSLALAAMFAAGSCIPAYATAGSTGTEVAGTEVNGASLTVDGAVEGHTYKVYQLFKGTASSDGTKLSNVQYGENYTGTDMDADLAALEAEGADAKAFAEVVKDKLSGDPVTVLTKESPSAALEAGYYMVMDESDGSVDSDAVSDYIVTIAGNAIVKPKAVSVPEFDKSIDEGEPEPEIPEGADLSPETADIDWDYTLHEDTGVITLNYYIGTKPDVKVYSHYKVKGSNKVYKANLLSNTLWSKSPYMFAGREDIKSVTFSNSLDTASCTGMAAMFSGCSTIESIDFGNNFDTSNVESMSYMFNGCKNIASIDVSMFQTEKVSDMSSMFYSCENLTSIDTKNWNNKNVNYMTSMFFKCSSLNDINISIGMHDVNMDWMFMDCSNIKDINMSVPDIGQEFNTHDRPIYTCENMFCNCKLLTHVNLSNFNAQISNAGGMFYDCSSLTDIEFGDLIWLSFNAGNMFYNCNSLEHIDLTNVYSTAADMSGMFSGCTRINELDLRNFSTYRAIYENGNGLTNIFDNPDLIIYARSTEQLDEHYIDGYDGWFLPYCGINTWTQESDRYLGWYYSEEIFMGPYKDIILEDSPVSSVIPFVGLIGKTYASAEQAENPVSIDIEGTDITVDYGTGSHIPFKLEAVMPESITAYKKYKLVFHDNLSEGMEYDQESLKVYADGTEIPAGNYTVGFSENGRSLTVTMDDVKASPYNATAGTKITVKYTTTLLDGADPETSNEAYLEYSNDPKGNGMGTTGGNPDVVTVITFSMKFNKVDKEGSSLPGAGFTLYKKAEDDTYTELKTINGTTAFYFNGLATGDYKLVESTTPDGYNTMDDIEFKIIAEDATDEAGNPIKRVKLTKTDGSAMDGWTAVAADKAFKTDIANYAGRELPSTGGIGTYLFYIAGAAVVLMVGIVVVTRKKVEE